VALAGVLVVSEALWSWPLGVSDIDGAVKATMIGAGVVLVLFPLATTISFGGFSVEREESTVDSSSSWLKDSGHQLRLGILGLSSIPRPPPSGRPDDDGDEGGPPGPSGPPKSGFTSDVTQGANPREPAQAGSEQLVW
jgi:hypothetical protein